MCFRTGDSVRVTEEGNLIFLGRQDQQVKVRGFRVDLGEVEAALLKHRAVRNAIAAMHGSEVSSRRIVAYATVDRGRAEEGLDLKAYVAELLPSYMVPATVTILESLPLLPNGKLDRAAVARNESMPEQPSPDAGLTPVEETLLSILKDVLEVNRAGPDDDFFALGGTSLLAFRYMLRVCEVCSVDLNAADLMHVPTVRGLAQRMARECARQPNSPTPAQVVAPLAASKMWRPLALARAEGEFEEIDAAAIACLPDDALTNRAFLALRAARAAPEPYWIGACRTPIGTIALVVAPVTERELFGNIHGAHAALEKAVTCGARLGARCISLTGLIPAATNFGRELASPDGVAVTTGYAATACAMALTIKSAVKAAGRELRQQAIAFVGLGPIGAATVRLLLECVGHPRALSLCDLPGRLGDLQILAHEVRARHGFTGHVKLTSAMPILSEQIYAADLIVGAINASNVIDVERLRPGTIIVDYSFPSCFDFDRAMRRFASAGDIMVTAGGTVRLAGQANWTFRLPAECMPFAQNGCRDSLLPSSTAMTGCILSSLLPISAGVPATRGEVTIEECRGYWTAMEALGIDAAPLHWGSWRPTDQDISQFQVARARAA